MKSEIKDELSYKVIGCAMKVQGLLGSGFQEVIYQRALSIEFEKENISFDRELNMQIFYRKFHVGTRRVDFFVEDKLVVEIKAVANLNDSHLAQAISYCKAFKQPYGLLLNFGSRNLEYKRVYNVTS